MKGKTLRYFPLSYQDIHHRLLDFLSISRCSSDVGAKYIDEKGMDHQVLSIGKGCEYKGTVIHEMLHAVGLFHEHGRLDRDQYIKVLKDHIKDSEFIKDNITSRLFYI